MTLDATLPMLDLQDLIRAVQRNCDIADARHAREATMCTYLLQMRELYRWERGLPLEAPPAKEALSRWLPEREELWNTLEDEDYAPLPLANGACDPFDVRLVNRALQPMGLAYGAGYGRFQRPHFFLAELERNEMRDGVRVLVCGREHARDIAAIPGALQGDTIHVRRDALRRWLWEKVELWRSREHDGALARAIDCAGIGPGGAAAFEQLVETETETLILHELGEARAARLLGPGWEDMLGALADRRAELLARAVRDNLADCLSTLPALLDGDARTSIHFYFSQLDGMRRELFPALAAGYRDWCESGAAGALRGAVASGAAHWERVARTLLDTRPLAEPRSFAL